jgi:hypothetical protein
MPRHDIRGIIALALETYGRRGEFTLAGQPFAAVGRERLACEPLPASRASGEMFHVVGVLHFLSLGATALKNSAARRRIFITSFCAYFAVVPNSSAISGML